MTNDAENELKGAAALAFAKALNKEAVDQENWVVTFVDPVTGDYWTLDYPNSSAHGGGSPRLRRERTK